MRNIVLQVSLILTILSLALGNSIDKLGNTNNVKSKSHEAMIEAFGIPRSSLDLNFGDNPVIERDGNSNVKTNRRRNTVREPSIQAYGLPKKQSQLENNGHIERLNLDRVSGLDGKVDKVNVNHEAGIRAYGMPKRVQENNGFIETIGDDYSTVEKKVSSKEAPPFPKVLSNYRTTRSVDDKNHLTDLEAQEAKVFRPLFVYRQQVADRYRLKQKKNPIYGAYQYGKNKQRNSIYVPEKY